ncbi:MAG: NAD(P)-binding domain-containing protein [Pseudomonadota bacterium]
MKIGILGTGNVGGRLFKLCRHADHDVIAGSRSGETSFLTAAQHGDVVVLATHYHVAAEVLSPLRGALAGKILVDATNPLKDDWSPLLLGQENSAGEEIAKLLPDSQVVKAFNTVFADIMTPEGLTRGGAKAATFVAGDAPDAVKSVADFANSLGFEAEGINTLSAAGYLEGLAHLNIRLAVGEGGGTNAAFLYHRG